MSAPVVTAALEPSDFDRVWVTWQPSTGEPLGYEVEMSVDGAPFEGIHEGPLSIDTLGLPVHLPFEVPELVSIAFRVRAVGSDGEGPWGGPAEVTRTLRPPLFFWASLGTATTTLTWATGSLAQTSWLLERRLVDATGATAEEWTELPVPFPADRLDDPRPPAGADGATFIYRLRARAGEVLSAATDSTVTTPLLAPTDLGYSPQDGAIALSWSNHSAFASYLVVLRSPPMGFPEVEAAVLPPTATQFLDEGLAPATYRYRVLARRALPAYGALVGSSLPLLAATALPTGQGPLVPSTLALPMGADSVARGTGWYVATGLEQPSSGTAVFVPTAGGFDRHDLVDGSRLLTPGVLLDPLGRPHVVYGEGPRAWTTEMPIVHEWLEDGTWHREVIAARILSAGDGCQDIRAAIDADGALHVVWMAGPSPEVGLEYATNAGGTWVVESVSSALPAERRVRYALFKVGVAADGEVHLLLNDWGSLFLAIRADGAWTVESIPVGTVSASYPEGDLGFARAEGTTLVAYRIYSGDGAGLYAVTREGPAAAGVWSDPVLLEAGTSVAGLRAAASPTGRLAVARSESAPSAWVRDAGVWSSWSGFPYGGDVEIGFRPDGRLWLLDLFPPVQWEAPLLGLHMLYEEP